MTHQNESNQPSPAVQHILENGIEGIAMADAEAAERAAKAAKARPPKAVRAARPSLSPEDAGKPTAKGVPKNVEDAAQ